MNEFLLVFRRDVLSPQPAQSPEEMQSMMKLWQDWMGSIAAQNKLVTAGNRLSPVGTVIKPNNIVTDGPFVEIKESIAGYTIIRAESQEDATEISKGCPILKVGGNVEVRSMISMG
ncbi:MAG: transcription initiation protein [Bacteroidetes bacterium]|nr:transcription initiation protein [Bacteroidota bacterium]